MESFQRLVEIVKTLRGPNGCPWDKAQDHDSLTPYAIEEAYELEEAIRNKDWPNIKEELGDLLFQSVLHGQLASESNRFDIDDILEGLNEKMVRRHPHVFSEAQSENSKDLPPNTPDQVVITWDQIKAAEKQQNSSLTVEETLEKAPLTVPGNFPGLLRAQKIGKKTAKVQFDWENPGEVCDKVAEEWLELKQAIDAGSKKEMAEELGDLLFSLAQLGRHLELDTETCLRDANTKFLLRYKTMLELHPQWSEFSREEKESSWNRAKKSLDKKINT